MSIFLCCPSRLKFTSLFICLVADLLDIVLFFEASNLAKTDDASGEDWIFFGSFLPCLPTLRLFTSLENSRFLAAWMFQFSALLRHRQAFVKEHVMNGK